MAFRPDSAPVEQNNQENEEIKLEVPLGNVEEKLKGKKISRRGFLGAMAAGAAALATGELLAGEIPLNERGVDYFKKQIAELSYEGEDFEKAPGVGMCEKEALIFQYMLLPRNVEELEKMQQFLHFIHGREFRTEVVGQLTTLKKDPEAFDKKGWEFYKRYFHGRKMVKMTAKATSKEKLSREYSQISEMGLSPETNQDMIRWKLQQERSHWSDFENEITVDMSDHGFVAIPPSVVLRHETDHATQKSEFVSFAGGKSTVKEIVSLFDGMEIALIDKELRREKGLSTNKDEKGQELYSKPIKFPSGQEYRICDLLNMCERFYDMKGKENFPRTFVEILSHPASFAFFENLIYGNPSRSADIYKKWQAGIREWREKSAEYKRNPVEFLIGYLENKIKKNKEKYPDWYTKKHAGITEDEYRRKMIEKIKKNPEEMHKTLVADFRIEDDPFYYSYYGRGKGYYVRPGNIKNRDESDILRSVIEANSGVRDFWDAKNLVEDLDADQIAYNIKIRKQEAKKTPEQIEKERREEGDALRKSLGLPPRKRKNIL